MSRAPNGRSKGLWCSSSNRRLRRPPGESAGTDGARPVRVSCRRATPRRDAPGLCGKGSARPERSAAVVAPRKYAGELVTHVRIYNSIIMMFFFGGRGKLDHALVEKSGAADGQQILDVGAGPGFLVRRLAEKVGPQGRVIGLD